MGLLWLRSALLALGFRGVLVNSQVRFNARLEMPRLEAAHRHRHRQVAINERSRESGTVLGHLATSSLTNVLPPANITNIALSVHPATVIIDVVKYNFVSLDSGAAVDRLHNER